MFSKSTVKLVAATMCAAFLLSSCNNLAEDEHYVIIGETNGVVLSTDTDRGRSGDRITITVESVPEGETLQDIYATANGSNIDVIQRDESTYYFLMPNAETTITATLEGQSTYQIGVDNRVSASYTYFIQEAFGNYNDLEAISPDIYEASSGYSYRLQLQKVDGSADTGVLLELCYGENYSTVVQLDYDVEKTGNRIYSFMMPSSNARINIYENESAYGVTMNYDSSQLSSLTLSIWKESQTYPLENPGDIKQGTMLYLQFVFATASYNLTSVTGSENIVDLAQLTKVITDTTSTYAYSFTMPAGDVTLNIVLEAIAA